MKDNFAELIKAAGNKIASDGPTVSPDLERRVMIEVARRAIEGSRRRARRGLVASLVGLAMLLAGCIAALVVWFPALAPALTRFTWLENLRIPKLFDTVAGSMAGVAESTATLPFLEQWGGLILLVLLVVGAAGFIYYLNSLFSGDRIPERFNESR